MTRLVLVVVLLSLLAGLAYAIVNRLETAGVVAGGAGAGNTGPVPVEVAAVLHGPIEDRRVFSGTLEAFAEFDVAPKVSGRIERMEVNIGDTVRRGQVIASLDDDEIQQDVKQAEAALAVAQANLAEAENALEIAERRYDRTQTLNERGISSESQLDVARADRQARMTELEVARAIIRRSEAELASARVRLSYTQVTAAWPDGDDERVVSERYVDAGNTVGANAPLVRVIETDPLLAIVSVTEKDYARLRVGQTASLATDAYPGRRFEATIVRFAPVFRQASRQARVELEVPNPEHVLKPGMFVRAEIILDRVEDAVIVPREALVQRGGSTMLFVVEPSGGSVRLRPVTLGIIDRERVQVIGDRIAGRVVVLGQQLLKDGSAITIPDDEPRDAAPEPPAEPAGGATTEVIDG